ncbi:DUF6354 family protein [Nonomuraea sp. CA-218870]|uniref:DUF6354 family protein n=1 Tax=Nonomuraea sp. CA-218870 TaxID=3239998 RepID=UPI003D9069C2
MPETPNVRPGQVWMDNDKRSEGRRVRVIEVDDTHATVVGVDIRGLPDSRNRVAARRTRIRLDRFRPTSTGYRLVADAPEED